MATAVDPHLDILPWELPWAAPGLDDSPMDVTGGIRVDLDGRTRGTFTHNPSSGRLSMVDPNLQQIPRGGGLASLVKQMFVAPSGHLFWERDFSGIEAVLVGYFAGSRRYTNLAKIDVHSFYTAYALNALDGSFPAADLPDPDWPDDRLRPALAAIKREYGAQRNSLYKHLVHGANYRQTPKGSQRKIFKDTGRAFDVRTIARVMGVYFELFPEIKIWHRNLCHAVDGTKRREVEGPVDPWSMGVCYVKNPFNYCHHFYSVLDWERVGTEWVATFSDDSKRLVSFLPQSTAAAIIKKAAKRLWYEYPHVGETLRLLIHDSIMGECPEEAVEECLRVSDLVMSAPIEELPLDPAWGMGTYLTIGTEPKVGPSWAAMH